MINQWDCEYYSLEYPIYWRRWQVSFSLFHLSFTGKNLTRVEIMCKIKWSPPKCVVLQYEIIQYLYPCGRVKKSWRITRKYYSFQENGQLTEPNYYNINSTLLDYSWKVQVRVKCNARQIRYRTRFTFTVNRNEVKTIPNSLIFLTCITPYGIQLEISHWTMCAIKEVLRFPFSANFYTSSWENFQRDDFTVRIYYESIDRAFNSW